MIAELKNTLQKVEKLPEEEQKILAKLIDEEMQWEESLIKSSGKLSSLAEEAKREYHSGKTKQADW